MLVHQISGMRNTQLCLQQSLKGHVSGEKVELKVISHIYYYKRVELPVWRNRGQDHVASEVNLS